MADKREIYSVSKIEGDITRRHFLLHLPIALIVGSSVASAKNEGEYDEYAGWRKIRGTKTGFFHTQRIGGRWWFVTPQGHGFFSMGVNTVHYAAERDRVPAPLADPAKWAEFVSTELRGWGFNTVGAWSAKELYHTHIAYSPVLNLATSFQDLWIKGDVVDYFSTEFHETADRVAKEECASYAQDPWLLGYFTDNELHWGADWRSQKSVLELYLEMPQNSPGFERAIGFLKRRNKTAGNLSKEDRLDFQEIAANEYARVCHEAVRRYDPNHAIIGCRLAGVDGTPVEPVARGLGPYFDVIDYHSYDRQAPVGVLERITRASGKPTMISEFSFRAMDSGLPNTKGPGEPVGTQEERAKVFAHYAGTLASLPNCIGYHWFQYRDEPKQGRSLDGENSNYGVVKINGQPWETLTRRMKRINFGLYARAAAAS
jgi:hypothetical protein